MDEWNTIFSSWNEFSYFSFSSDFRAWVSRLELPNFMCKRSWHKNLDRMILLRIFRINWRGITSANTGAAP